MRGDARDHADASTRDELVGLLVEAHNALGERGVWAWEPGLGVRPGPARRVRASVADRPFRFVCVPDESGGVADTPWILCAACGIVAALERADGWRCSGCGGRLGFRPVLDRDPGDEQPEAAA